MAVALVLHYVDGVAARVRLIFSNVGIEKVNERTKRVRKGFFVLQLQFVLLLCIRLPPLIGNPISNFKLGHLLPDWYPGTSLNSMTIHRLILNRIRFIGYELAAPLV
jgi:hypothetical protein